MIGDMYLMDINNIEKLISLKQEGSYWDFKREWYSQDKKADLLHDIICMANNLSSLDEEAKAKIHLYFEQQTLHKDENFANGRLVRNLYDDLVMNHAKRVINIANPDSAELSTIKAEDFTFVIDENVDK